MNNKSRQAMQSEADQKGSNLLYAPAQQRGHGETNTCIDFAPNNMFQGSKGDAQGVQEEIARFEGYELFLNSVG